MVYRAKRRGQSSIRSDGDENRPNLPSGETDHAMYNENLRATRCPCRRLCVCVRACVFFLYFGDSPSDQGETCTSLQHTQGLPFAACFSFCLYTNRDQTGRDKHRGFFLLFVLLRCFTVLLRCLPQLSFLFAHQDCLGDNFSGRKTRSPGDEFIQKREQEFRVLLWSALPFVVRGAALPLPASGRKLPQLPVALGFINRLS